MKTIKLIKKSLATIAIFVALGLSDNNPSTKELIASVILVLLSVSVLMEDQIKKYY